LYASHSANGVVNSLKILYTKYKSTKFATYMLFFKLLYNAKSKTSTSSNLTYSR
jgi:hypothetical protein